MPAAANLVINNNAAVAKTFTLLQPASGLGSEARWELQEGAHSGVFPKISAITRPDSTAPKSRPGTASVMKLMLPQAVVDTTTSLTTMGSWGEIIITSKIKDDFPEALKLDLVAYAQNLVALAIVKEYLKGRTSFT